MKDKNKKIGRPKELKGDISIKTIYATDADYEYLRLKGINYSSFFRQAVQAHKQGKMEYEY